MGSASTDERHFSCGDEQCFSMLLNESSVPDNSFAIDSRLEDSSYKANFSIPKGHFNDLVLTVPSQGYPDAYKAFDPTAIVLPAA